MPRGKAGPDDPFESDDWGPEGASIVDSDEMPGVSSEERPAFLKPHHVKSDLGTLNLLRVTGETSEFSDVILLVEHSGKNFRLGLRTFSDDYKALTKRFGKKKSDWHGELRFKVMPHKGQRRGYIAVR